MKFSLILALAYAWVLPAVALDDVSSTFVSEGVTDRVGGYRPVRAEMSDDASKVKTAPSDLSAPKYGTLVFGKQEFGFILDEPEDGEAALYVDTNSDGDFTNDPKAVWESTKRGEFTMYSGSAKVQLADDQLAAINLYRFDPKDSARAQLVNTMLYYGDFGYEFTIPMDGQTFKTFSAGTLANGDMLWIDRDGNGNQSYNYEMVVVGEPFNFTGTTYVLDVKEGKLSISISDEKLEQKALPPDLSIGKKALEFAATTIEGETINFPSSFAGKVVMLDFWATWCGPCIGEIPNMKAAYEAHHGKGFEILGISFDQADMKEQITQFTEKREMPWPQIYEGKGWETSLGKMHDVSGIPFVLLVDGDSGEILATSRQLRGEGLSDFIGQTLEKRANTKDGADSSDSKQ